VPNRPLESVRHWRFIPQWQSCLSVVNMQHLPDVITRVDVLHSQRSDDKLARIWMSDSPRDARRIDRLPESDPIHTIQARKDVCFTDVEDCTHSDLPERRHLTHNVPKVRFSSSAYQESCLAGKADDPTDGGAQVQMSILLPIVPCAGSPQKSTHGDYRPNRTRPSFGRCFWILL
jgi:hypothetical protein